MTFPYFRCTAYKNESREWSDSGVQATISDKRRSVCNEELRIAYFEAEVLTQSDYYPFGIMMPDRQWSAGAEGYRYGFNGMERDDETYGKGNALDFGARIYDSRLGRWLSVDPLQAKYASASPYNGMANNPIVFVDPDGRDIRFAIWVNDGVGNWSKKIVSYKDLSPKFKKAVDAFAQTAEGCEFLSQFAREGEKVGNIAFTKGRHSNHILEIEEFANYGSAYGTSSFRLEKGKAVFNIKINTERELEDENVESMALTMGHETFIHLDKYIEPVIKGVEQKDLKKLQELQDNREKSATDRRGGSDHDAYKEGKVPRMGKFVELLKKILSNDKVEEAKERHDKKY